MKCIKIRGKKRQLCVGDLDRVVYVENRNIQPSGNQDIDFKLKFSNPLLKYAMITTENGVTIFDHKNIEQVISHYFYILYDATVTAQRYVQFENAYFRIAKVQDYDERHQFMLLYCQEVTDYFPTQAPSVTFGSSFGAMGG